MCEHSTVNQNIPLRREARRRKILENSTNRLKLIEGINSSTNGNSLETYSEPEVQNFKSYIQPQILKNESSHLDLGSKFKNLITESKDFKEMSEYSEKEYEEEEEDDTEELFVRDTGKYSFCVPGFGFIIKKRLHYMLLAILVDVMFYFKVGYFFFDNIFCPFFSLKVAEVMAAREHQHNLVILLLVAGLPKRLQKYATIILSLLPGLISDLLLYIFVFIVGTKILNIVT